jgi:glutathione S-transferase
VDFSETTATPEIYRDIVEPRIGFPVIPVLLAPDNKAVQDTADIIDYVERTEQGRSVYPDGPVQKLVSLLLELYSDEWLVIPSDAPSLELQSVRFTVRSTGIQLLANACVASRRLLPNGSSGC